MTTQVRGACPLCGRHLFRRKNKREYKWFEIAHIFPLNPRLEEAVLLKDVVKLSDDPNDLDNLIPLCLGCHDGFDNPRTVEEYEKLAAIKRKLIREAAQQLLRQQYPLEADIRLIIAGLGSLVFDDSTEQADVSFDPKTIDSKLDETIPGTTKRKITNAVNDYYQYIRREFRDLEQRRPNASQLIYSQVRSFYQKQKTLDTTQAEIFVNLVAWLRESTASATTDAPEIVASFFVQNCEVFD